MELLNTRLQQEASRREVFERKSAELERINDELRLDNRRLIAEVDELKAKQSLSESYQLDDSDDDDDYENVDDITPPGEINGSTAGVIVNGSMGDAQTKPSTNNSSLKSNTNNSNRNNTEGMGLTISSGGGEGKGLNGPTGDIVIKVQTLKRKQKVLKAELQETMHQSVSYQDAFQKELDMRTRLEEKLESLRIRYDRLVEENDHMRIVLTNHCINVPPHQPITGKRRLRYSDPHCPQLLSHPPSFVPSGRPKSIASSDGTSSHTSSPSRMSKDRTPPSPGNGADENLRANVVENDEISRISGGDTESASELTVVSEEVGNEDVTSVSVSRKSSSSSLCLSEDESVVHIVIGDRMTTPTLTATHEIDSALLATTNEIASAKSFYEHVRQRLKSESDSD